ncbi:MAG: bifunctional hydroxymethylpyrimidine kinase/phosphomethylpyrimidine kinase [Candidatus Accumulibacter sp.]|nr:bifunctional hydroxymethylpyrimidine kinase/phosphomethylpyrimidine kinase [Accumulibacter sp.]
MKTDRSRRKNFGDVSTVGTRAGSKAATPPVVLSFAASDPSGGAGMQADLATFSALGCHGLSVLTALTAQDTRGVAEMRPIESAWVEKQARVVLDDIRVDAFKVGVLGSAENVRAVARIVAAYPGVPVVVDPVLASGRGDPLADAPLADALRSALFPLTFVATPNLPEARRLAATGGEDEETLPLDECARRFFSFGCAHVLLTGAHEDSPEVTNRLFDPTGETRTFSCKRLPGSYHGSGCTLASALAAMLARGLSVCDATAHALDFTYRALESAFRPGRGQFIPRRIESGRDSAPRHVQSGFRLDSAEDPDTM